MSGRAGSTAVREAGGFLRAISSTQQSYRLYPAGHPNRLEATRDVLGRAQSLRVALKEDPTVFVVRHSLYLGPVLLPGESLSLYRLIEAMEEAGIEAVEIRPTITEEDIDTLLRILAGDAPLDAQTQGIDLNRVRPTLEQDEWQVGLSELRRSYALGLELLRYTASSVAAGKGVDLEAATGVVEELADHVVLDPAQALLMTTVKSHDEYTYYHMLNVCLLSLALGFAAGLRQDQMVALGIGALLHDVGKVNVPLDVLRQVGPLNEEQWRLIQRHPVDGAGLIFAAGDTLFRPAASIVLEHHAAYDLSGYPSLSGRPHPSLPARMVSIADCFDAVTTDRPYRRAEDRRQALDILVAGSGRGFDPMIVRAFVRLLGIFPVGSLVRLDDGRVAVVMRNHERLLGRPEVRAVLDPHGNPSAPEELDLSERKTDGSFARKVVHSLDAEELGVDVAALLISGDLMPPELPGEDEPGLVHEPSFGEVPPPGYTPAHN